MAGRTSSDLDKLEMPKGALPYEAKGQRKEFSPSKGRIGKLILNTLGKKAKGGIQESLANPKIPLPLKAEGFLPPNLTLMTRRGTGS